MIVGEQITLPQVHTWQVYLAKNPNFFGLQKGDKIDFDDYELVAKIDGEYPPFQIAQDIDDAWVNNDTTLEVYGDNQNGCRSLSVSDIVCNTITGQCYIVNNIGYHLLEAVDSKSADTSDTERFIDNIYCEWCGELYDGTEILDNYTAKIVHRRCAASDNYDAESFETIIEKIDKEYSESGITADATDIYYELVKRHGARNKKDKKNQIKRALENFYQIDLEDFEASSYGNYYGACLLPDGSCTETSLDMCRSLGGRFQGPGTSCYPDDNYLKPRIMRSESPNQRGKGFLITIVAGAVSGLVAAVFGTVISEIILDRLREDPELEITDEDPETNTP